MKWACFAYLLLNEVIAEAFNREIVPNFAVNCNDRLADKHVRQTRFVVNSRIEVELIKHQYFIVNSTFVDSEE